MLHFIILLPFFFCHVVNVGCPELQISYSVQQKCEDVHLFGFSSPF